MHPWGLSWDWTSQHLMCCFDQTRLKPQGVHHQDSCKAHAPLQPDKAVTCISRKSTTWLRKCTHGA